MKHIIGRGASVPALFACLCLLAAIPLPAQAAKPAATPASPVPAAAREAVTPLPTVAPWLDPDLAMEDRITSLIHAMKLEEKLDALSTVPDVPRLKVYGSDHVEGLHGLALGGPAQWGGWGREQTPTTQFPQVVGLGETWDADLIRQVAGVEAWEARYIFNSEGKGGIVMRAPNADLARDVRWGRIEESYGEDPFLVATMSRAFIRGLQGDDKKYLLTASLMKHFLANSNEDGRGGSSSDFDQALFWEYYSMPFRWGITQANAQAYMTAYNAWNKIPMTAHPVIRDVTFKQWGLDGIVCTDAGAMSNMSKDHHYSKNLVESAAMSIKAGVNQFLEDRRVYKPALKAALEKGLITEADIDQNLRGVYRVMIRLGLLDPADRVPYSAIRGDSPAWDKPEHKALALNATLESMVLLKNGGVLPLDKKKMKKVAVIGPWADQVLLDWYSGTPGYEVSALQGIKDYLGPDVEVTWVSGVDFNEDEAVAAAKAADAAIVIEGNHPTGEAGWAQVLKDSYGKEAVDRKSMDLEDESLVKAVWEANPDTILVLCTSFPYAIKWSKEHVKAIVHMTHNSQESGTALAKVLFGDYNPAGRLVHTWPESWDQLLPMMDYDIRHGRTYLYSTAKALFPFGYGLSYTSFAWSGLRTSARTIKAGTELTVQVDVKNTGKRDGDEVVQIYVSRKDRKEGEAIRALRGFTRVTVPAGKTVTALLTLRGDDLMTWDEKLQAPALRKGILVVQAGASSEDIRASLEIKAE